MKLIRWVEVQLGRRSKTGVPEAPPPPSDSPRPRCRIRTNPWLRWRPPEADSSLWEGDEDTPYCPAAYCRPIPRSAWIDFADFQLPEKGDADSGTEDYDSEGTARCSGGEMSSPVADSACGSSADCSSCSSTPLSEGAPEATLAAKVARLQRTRDALDRRMAEARREEAARRDDRLQLRRELAQFRRLLLLQTLAELRGQLEKKTREQTWK